MYGRHRHTFGHLQHSTRLEAEGGSCSGSFAFLPFGAQLFLGAHRGSESASRPTRRRVISARENPPAESPIARLTASTDPIVGWSGRRRRWAVAIEPAASRARQRHRHSSVGLARPGCPVIFYHKSRAQSQLHALDLADSKLLVRVRDFLTNWGGF